MSCPDITLGYPVHDTHCFPLNPSSYTSQPNSITGVRTSEKRCTSEIRDLSTEYKPKVAYREADERRVEVV